MDNTTMEALQKFCPTRSYSTGDIIFRQDDECNEFFYLKSGLIQTINSSQNGDERVLMTMWPGSVFGASTFIERLSHKCWCKVLEDSEVICIDRPAFERCQRELPGFLDVILVSLASDTRVLFEQLADTKLLDTNVKVARFICRRVEYSQCDVRDGHMLLFYNQTFIASVLGLSRWAVNKALTTMRNNGWIRTVYGGIELLDYPAVHDFAYN